MFTRSFFFPVLLAFVLVYVAHKLSRISRIGRWGWLISFGVLLLSVGGQFLLRKGHVTPGAGVGAVIAWTSGISLGALGVLLILSLPADAVLGIWFLVEKVRRAMGRPVDSTRRGFVSRAVTLGGLGAAGIITGVGAFQARAPRVKSVNVPVRGLHPSLNGLKIAQVSDLHVGPLILRSYVEGVAQAVNSARPDLIALTGDLVDGDVEELARHIEPLDELKAPLGVFFVTGNHEYYSGVEQWLAHFKKLGMTLLMNESRTFTLEGATLLVAGVTDKAGERFDPSHRSDPVAAMGEDGKTADFRLLLAHRPDSCFEAAPVGFHLQLSGHTHAGQFFPWKLFMPLVHRYYEGLNRHENMWVYVNAGTGYWGPPNRFNVPSEITLLTLHAV